MLEFLYVFEHTTAYFRLENWPACCMGFIEMLGGTVRVCSGADSMGHGGTWPSPVFQIAGHRGHRECMQRIQQ